MQTQSPSQGNSLLSMRRFRYLPATFCIVRLPSRTAVFPFFRWPNAFTHVTVGVGRPLALHSSVTFSPSSTMTEEGFWIISAATTRNRHWANKLFFPKLRNENTRFSSLFVARGETDVFAGYVFGVFLKMDTLNRRLDKQNAIDMQIQSAKRSKNTSSKAQPILQRHYSYS